MKYLAPLNTAASTAPELVVRRLRDAILIGDLRPGDRLAPESELSRSFGMATMTVRVALGALKDLGLLSTVRGRNGGNFIALDAGQRLAAAASETKFSRAEIRDLTDWRRAISGEACFLAAGQATSQDLDLIRAAGVQFDQLLNSFPDLRIADAHLHTLIASASKSSHLERQEIEIQSLLSEVILSVAKVGGTKRLATYSHDPIIEAIATGNGAAAREAMLEHAEDTFNWATIML